MTMLQVYLRVFDDMGVTVSKQMYRKARHRATINKGPSARGLELDEMCRGTTTKREGKRKEE